MADIIFYILAALALGGSIGVVAARNPVGSLLFMITALGAVAGIFVLLEAHFLAAIQVMVYAGAILVLFLFVIMLLNLGHDYQKDLKGGLFTLLSFAVTGALAGILARQLPGTTDSSLQQLLPGAASIDAAQQEYGAIGAIAQPLFIDYVVPFEITGILLLVAVVGAIALAKRRV